MNSNKVKICFEITLKHENQKEELIDLIDYALELFAIPEDAKKIKKMHKEVFTRDEF